MEEGNTLILTTHYNIIGIPVAFTFNNAYSIGRIDKEPVKTKTTEFGNKEIDFTICLLHIRNELIRHKTALLYDMAYLDVLTKDVDHLLGIGESTKG